MGDVVNDTQSVDANKSTKRRKRHYVGVVGEVALEVFTALAKSDEAKPAKYTRVYGPFNTAKGANYLVRNHAEFDLNAKKLPMRKIEQYAKRVNNLQQMLAAE